VLSTCSEGSLAPGATKSANTDSKETHLEIRGKQPTAKAPAHMFTGHVWIDSIAQGQEPSRIRVNAVHFTPAARTAWHSHAVGQTLYVTEGPSLVQSRGGEIVHIRPGTIVYTPPDEGDSGSTGQRCEGPVSNRCQASPRPLLTGSRAVGPTRHVTIGTGSSARGPACWRSQLMQWNTRLD